MHTKLASFPACSFVSCIYSLSTSHPQMQESISFCRFYRSPPDLSQLPAVHLNNVLLQRYMPGHPGSVFLEQAPDGTVI